MATLAVDESDRQILEDLLTHYERQPALPTYKAFRIRHEAIRQRIDGLIEERLIERVGDHLLLRRTGLRALGSAEAQRFFERANELVPVLQAAYRELPEHRWSNAELGERAGWSAEEVARVVTLLYSEHVFHQVDFEATGFIGGLSLHERILDCFPAVWSDDGLDEEAPAVRAIQHLEIDGYRPFAEFSADLGPITVIIGANASGKSALFGALRLLAFAAANPFPPEIDPFLPAGTRLFHEGDNGPRSRFRLAVTAALGGKKPLVYSCDIAGPAGQPRVTSETLTTTQTRSEQHDRPFAFLQFTSGKGFVREPREKGLARPAWNLPPNELALRRGLDPTLATVSRFQSYVSSWKVYGGFDVGAGAPMRAPQVTEEAPILDESGDNLSAVLNSMFLSDPGAWEELSSLLGSAVPGFESLRVAPRGKGLTIGIWRERGLRNELTLTDLSDGTLRLIAWLTLALGPNPAPLLCIDEPELGLHPRVLPILAGAFKLAAARTQLIIATHSPYLLSQFDLDDIAVIKRQEGHSLFVRPSSNAALRAEVDEIGGDAIARMHISDELEVRS